MIFLVYELILHAWESKEADVAGRKSMYFPTLKMYSKLNEMKVYRLLIFLTLSLSRATHSGYQKRGCLKIYFGKLKKDFLNWINSARIWMKNAAGLNNKSQFQFTFPPFNINTFQFLLNVQACQACQYAVSLLPWKNIDFFLILCLWKYFSLLSWKQPAIPLRSKVTDKPFKKKINVYGML